jgi:hypothetical protein
MFTADITTTVGQVRYLIGDTDPAKPIFDDATIQGFNNIAPDQSLYLTCALASDAMAALAAKKLNDIVLGPLKIDQTSKVKALQEQATRFRNLEYNTPAFAVIEENLSGFNELTIIRNFILRTEL